MLFLFPAIPFEIAQIDPDFADEHAAAQCVGAARALIDYEALLEGDLPRALRRVPAQREPATAAVLRGWMLRADQYRALYDDLLHLKNICLINTPEQYAACHELPGWIDRAAAFTPETLIVPGVPPDIPAFVDAVQTRFQTGGVIVKDSVKSRKHEWLDACYVPDVADSANLRRVAENFTRGQGPGLTGGLVARRFVSLRPQSVDDATGLSVAEEWRVFRVNASAILTVRYWHNAAPRQSSPDPALSDALFVALDALGSRFYTADFAIAENGELLLIEIGDGQVSDIRDPALIPRLYSLLAVA